MVQNGAARDCYLILVDGFANNNKFYKMHDNGTTIDCEYGRVQKTSCHASYPSSDWNKKYREKINKGYVDKTDLHVLSQMADTQTKKAVTRFADITDLSISHIVDRLQRMAKEIIQRNYTVTSEKVTPVMIEEAQDAINTLIYAKDIHSFNHQLVELFEIIPRQMGNVGDYLARNNNDFQNIIVKEQNLLDVMRGQVVQNATLTTQRNDAKQQKNEKKAITILEALGLTIEPVADKDVKIIKEQLGESAGRYVNAWKVTNKKTQSMLEKYTTEHKAKTKLLWHGSRNENWWSILKSGLLLHPTNAAICGHMFGIGTYFADKAQKSIGYTSSNGSYWAHGNSSTGFLALYKVAVGKSYDVRSWRNGLTGFTYQSLQHACPGADSLFAHKGADLRNNEIVVYKEDQTSIQYLVEFH